MSSSQEKHDSSLEFAKAADAADPLRKFRSSFHFPEAFNNLEPIYLTGNSLGLMPKTARAYVDQELDDWARLAVEAHMHAKHPWLPYHEFVTDPMARVVRRTTQLKQL
jgi:kynureninase